MFHQYSIDIPWNIVFIQYPWWYSHSSHSSHNWQRRPSSSARTSQGFGRPFGSWEISGERRSKHPSTTSGPGEVPLGTPKCRNDRPFLKHGFFQFFPNIRWSQIQIRKTSVSRLLPVSCTKVWPYTYSQCPSDQMDNANQDPRKQQRINECTGLRRWISVDRCYVWSEQFTLGGERWWKCMMGINSAQLASNTWLEMGGTTPDPVGFDLAWSSLGLLVEGPENSEMSPIHHNPPAILGLPTFLDRFSCLKSIEIPDLDAPPETPSWGLGENWTQRYGLHPHQGA